MITSTRLGGGGSTRIAEDVLADKGGVLLRRGPLLFQDSPENGFPDWRQHHEFKSPRNPNYVGQYPRALRVTGRGAAADGYGSLASGAAVYKNMSRARENEWVTFSLVLSLEGESAGCIENLGIHQDSQGSDNARRNYPKVKFNFAASQWQVVTNQGTYIDIPGATFFGGFNELKRNQFYFSLGFYYATSTPSQPHPAPFGQIGFLQAAGKVYDLRGLGSNWGNYPPQVGTPEDSFATGQNFGVGGDTPLPGKVGGFNIHRAEVTYGDELAA